MRNKLTWVIILLVVFLLAGGLSFAVEMYFDWLWFGELGKTTLFTTALYAKSFIFAAILALAFLFLYINFWIAHRGPGSIKIGIPTPDGRITAYTFEPSVVQRVLGLLSLLAGFLLALRGAAQWEILWKWHNRVDFGFQDPIFGRDISFYFFTLPLLEELIRFGLAAVLSRGCRRPPAPLFQGVLIAPHGANVQAGPCDLACLRARRLVLPAARCQRLSGPVRAAVLRSSVDLWRQTMPILMRACRC